MAERKRERERERKEEGEREGEGEVTTSPVRGNERPQQVLKRNENSGLEELAQKHPSSKTVAIMQCR